VISISLFFNIQWTAAFLHADSWVLFMLISKIISRRLMIQAWIFFLSFKVKVMRVVARGYWSSRHYRV
jgi:hypothetical protein